jgi:hypothetical protein
VLFCAGEKLDFHSWRIGSARLTSATLWNCFARKNAAPHKPLTHWESVVVGSINCMLITCRPTATNVTPHGSRDVPGAIMRAHGQ